MTHTFNCTELTSQHCLPARHCLASHMVRLVLFDIDGTLIQTGGAGVKAFGRACEMEFTLPNGTQRLNFAGRTDTGLAREFFLHNRIEPSPENFHAPVRCRCVRRSSGAACHWGG